MRLGFIFGSVWLIQGPRRYARLKFCLGWSPRETRAIEQVRMQHCGPEARFPRLRPVREPAERRLPGLPGDAATSFPFVGRLGRGVLSPSNARGHMTCRTHHGRATSWSRWSVAVSLFLDICNVLGVRLVLTEPLLPQMSKWTTDGLQATQGCVFRKKCQGRVRRRRGRCDGTLGSEHASEVDIAILRCLRSSCKYMGNTVLSRSWRLSWRLGGAFGTRPVVNMCVAGVPNE